MEKEIITKAIIFTVMLDLFALTCMKIIKLIKDSQIGENEKERNDIDNPHKGILHIIHVDIFLCKKIINY
ncbi:hypothetical protein [Xenorhabdus bovienii]|uniref:hypothetical protein n=2 Tax=Xenorhabdus bovienii TaxID=40576 RepID=UPI00237CCD5D|nr:hypothetical protein [Xenorhabdus bovienii]MDE1476384.1 hypothetical protein [Xenorhabdus bovienii]MDE9458891.1 hypothetical protein [Xenorhabdus bovienii]MDE9515860.1 hypothetical protein [Xenorhabdus bovienii]MDE9539689.1 hypothetical protein [Xenorhabdus bovienii]